MRSPCRRLTTALLSILSALLFIPASSAHAQLQSPGINYKVESIAGADQFCMDAKQDRAADGTQVFLFRCNGRPNQRWAVTQSANNQSAIIGLDGFCLDVRGDSGKTGTPVQLWKCHFGANQRFNLSPDGRIREVGSGKCLLPLNQTDGAPIVLASCRMLPFEQWQFQH
jgi:hypothetical protein